jgi:hypothetical protein
LGYNYLMSDKRVGELLCLLASRLERLSVDSSWARRASGLRGNILKVLAQLENGERIRTTRIKILEEAAFDILQRAAQEIPDQKSLEKNRQ